MHSTVTDKGQITLPKALRDALSIQPGSRIEFTLQADQMVQMRVLARGSAGLYGLLALPGESQRTLDAIDKGVSEAVLQRQGRG